MPLSVSKCNVVILLLLEEEFENFLKGEFILIKILYLIYILSVIQSLIKWFNIKSLNNKPLSKYRMTDEEKKNIKIPYF